MVQKLLIKHSVLLTIAGLSTCLFWVSKEEGNTLIQALGDTSFLLLAVTLLIGPVVRLYPSLARLIPWRRPFGIWTFLLALFHAIYATMQFSNFQISKMLGIEQVSHVYIRTMPSGFGLANLLAYTALLIFGILAITSSDLAVRKLGSASWKWLHRMVYVGFYLAFYHAFYFIFIHYMPQSLAEADAGFGENWIKVPFLLLGISVILAQVFAFIKTIKLQSTN